MSVIELAQRIESLPVGKREAVLRLVAALSIGEGSSRSMPEGLVERFDSQRERLAKLYGPFGDSTEDVRRLRDEGR